MQYDIEKLIDILVIFTKRRQRLTKLRINKLLYFIDKFHLRKYGRFVLNDRYHRLNLGPIPSLTSDLLNEFFDPEFLFSGKSIKKEKNKLKKYFSPGKYRGRYDTLALKKDVNFNSLSNSEIEIIDMVIQKYGNYSTSNLVNISHKDATWIQTSEPKEIDYELFLEGLPEERKKIIRDMMEIDKENDRVNAALNK